MRPVPRQRCWRGNMLFRGGRQVAEVRAGVLSLPTVSIRISENHAGERANGYGEAADGPDVVVESSRNGR